jgi:hypothetical protein
MVEIKLRKDIVPDVKVITKAVLTGITASIVLFVINFFGLSSFFEFIPDGFETFALVFAATYLAHIFIIKHNGREVI